MPRHNLEDGDLIVVVETGFPCRVGTGETEAGAIECLMATPAQGYDWAARNAALRFAFLQGWVSRELCEEEGVEL